MELYFFLLVGIIIILDSMFGQVKVLLRLQKAIPEYITMAGYAWAALMFALGAGTIGVALSGDMKLWTFYVTVVLIGAKVAAFAIQYVVFRVLVTRRLRAAAAAS